MYIIRRQTPNYSIIIWSYIPNNKVRMDPVFLFLKLNFYWIVK